MRRALDILSHPWAQDSGVGDLPTEGPGTAFQAP